MSEYYCICLKDFYFGGTKIFEKNHSYLYEIWNEETIWVIYNMEGGVYDSGYQFDSGHQIDTALKQYNFNEYFCNFKKYRKLKLEKLNEF